MTEADHLTPDPESQLRLEIEGTKAGIDYLEHLVLTGGVERFPLVIPEGSTAIEALKLYTGALKSRKSLVDQLNTFTLPYAREKYERLLDKFVESTTNSLEDEYVTTHQPGKEEPAAFVQEPEAVNHPTGKPEEIRKPVANPPIITGSNPEVLTSGKETSVKSVPPVKPYQKTESLKPKRATEKPVKPKAERPDPNSVVINFIDGIISSTGRKTPMMYSHHFRLMQTAASQGGRATVSDFLSPDELGDIATVHQLEQAVKRMVADLEKDPSNPQVIRISGNGPSLSLQILKPIHLIQKE